MTEIYKDIKGYENLYQVSNLGNVKSLPKSNGNGNRERLLKLETINRDHTNYKRVSLSKDGKVKRVQVHRLVAEHFLDNPNNLPFVNHIDNNGENNNSTNLEWCSQKENMQHSSNQGRQDNPRSLGGIAASKKRYENNCKSYDKFIGQVFGNLTVVSYYQDTSGVNNRVKFKCVCSCGNTTEKGIGKLKTGAQACKECTYKIRSETRRSR
jgi:hypothetical protein